MQHPIPTDIATRLLALSQSAPLLIALFDEQDILQYANDGFLQKFGLHPEQRISWANIMRQSFEQQRGAHIQSDDFEHWLASASSRRGKQPYRAFESDLTDGSWIWMTETIDEHGWMLCVASDITALRTDSRALRESRDLALRDAQTDALTGLSNRRHILQLLAAQLASQNATCIALIDLDHFKQLNDQHGHPFGDSVLLDFAHHTRSLLRIADGLGRVGGEEFLLLMPNCSLSDADKKLHDILQHTRERHPFAAKPQLSYTFSAGMTILHPDDTVETAYARADAALYQAKQEGRNRLVIVP